MQSQVITVAIVYNPTYIHQKSFATLYSLFKAGLDLPQFTSKVFLFYVTASIFVSSSFQIKSDRDFIFSPFLNLIISYVELHLKGQKIFSATAPHI